MDSVETITVDNPFPFVTTSAVDGTTFYSKLVAKFKKEGDNWVGMVESKLVCSQCEKDGGKECRHAEAMKPGWGEGGGGEGESTS
jgi:hypothetical protein